MTKLTGTLVVEEDFDGTLKEVVQEFFDTYGVDPETVDGKDYVGLCDSCGAVILSDQTYAESDEEELCCEQCLELPDDDDEPEPEAEPVQLLLFTAESDDPED
jgi:hypothetical protein